MIIPEAIVPCRDSERYHKPQPRVRYRDGIRVHSWDSDIVTVPVYSWDSDIVTVSVYSWDSDIVTASVYSWDSNIMTVSESTAGIPIS